MDEQCTGGTDLVCSDAGCGTDFAIGEKCCRVKGNANTVQGCQIFYIKMFKKGTKLYHPIFTHDTNLEFTVVSSTGESETKPHCSSSSNCTFNAESKQKCAEALCKAQGFNSGMFLESSNNFCTNNYSSRKGWVYLYDMDQIGEQTSGSLPEAMITARCSDKKGKIV